MNNRKLTNSYLFSIISNEMLKIECWHNYQLKPLTKLFICIFLFVVLNWDVFHVEKVNLVWLVYDKPQYHIFFENWPPFSLYNKTCVFSHKLWLLPYMGILKARVNIAYKSTLCHVMRKYVWLLHENSSKSCKNLKETRLLRI